MIQKRKIKQKKKIQKIKNFINLKFCIVLSFYLKGTKRVFIFIIKLLKKRLKKLFI